MSSLNICLLCLQSSDVSIEILSRRGIELQLEAILKKHFWFQGDELEEKCICERCWRTVHDFHVLFTSVKLNQQRHIDFHVKSEIVDSNDYNESPTLLDTIKDEPDIDISKDSECFDTPCDGDTGDVKETNDNSLTVTRVKRKYNRRLTPTEKVYKTDTHTALLSTYFTMSCDLCDALLPTYREAKKHYKNVHDVKRGYLICCSKKFRRLQAMLQHCQWHMNPDSFKCEFCQKTFEGSYTLRNHINVCHAPENEKVFNCNDCDKVFSKQHYLNSHVKFGNCSHPSHLVSKIMRSPYFTFHKEHEMIRNRFLMQCDLCGEPFALFRHVKMHHAKAHNQEGYLYCCGKKFFKMSKVVQHCMWHDDPKSLKCSICDLSFIDKISLRDHIRKIHSPEVESFSESPISKSDRKVSVKDKMDVKKEKGDLQFECYICRQGFLILPLLQGHMKKVHRSVPAHICELCAKSFACAYNFKMHYINFHTDTSQRVQCEQCGKWFKNETGLKSHIRRHNSKTATCGICRRVCNSMEALRAHIRSTHREASLKCTVCDKMFKHRKVLQEHMAIHAGVKDLYTCTFCTKTFRSNANMYSHRKRSHPVELEQMKASLNCATPAATT